MAGPGINFVLPQSFNMKITTMNSLAVVDRVVRALLVLTICFTGAVSAADSPSHDMQSSGERVVRAFWDAFNRADWQAMDRLVTSDYRHHPPGKSLTLVQFKEGGAWVHQNLARYRLDIDSLIRQNDLIATRWTARGVHVGSFFGEKPTGREVVVQGMHFHRLAKGRIAEDWEVIDFDGLKHQVSGE